MVRFGIRINILRNGESQNIMSEDRGCNTIKNQMLTFIPALTYDGCMDWRARTMVSIHRQGTAATMRHAAPRRSVFEYALTSDTPV
jgi:hypothetical protein